MKAIVMAGGEGTRLRPLTADMPKPMAPLLGRPVLEHMLRLLKRCGVTEALLTLGYMAGEIESWAKAQPVEGLQIDCQRETRPLGTAGSVKAAAEWLGSEPFLVVSGDAVCDFDLRKAIAAHREKKAEALLVLTAAEDPGEYGSVVTDREGQILAFLEKPRADRVATDLINTGIYLLSPSVLERIPEGTPYDFGRDLFPRMLEESASLCGLRLNGYWCDVGSIPAYLGCCRDALLGRIRLDTAAPLRKNGVWSVDPLPDQVTILPPVYLGKGLSLEAGSVIGPNAVLEDDSAVAAGARVTGSVVVGASLRRGAVVSGSWLGTGAVIGERAIVSDGCAVGSGAVAGACSFLEPGTRLWPRRDVPQGERVSGSFEDRPIRGPLRFQAGGVISGEWNAQITPEACFQLGCAMAKGRERVHLAAAGGAAAQLVLAALECGIRAGGAAALECDADQEFVLARAAYQEASPLSLFARETAGRISLSLYGADGRQIPRDLERSLEAGAAGSLHIAPAENTGRLLRRVGYPEAIAREAAAVISPRAIASVRGDGPEASLLRRAMEKAGMKEQSTGALLQPEEGGFLLAGIDEDGVPFYARDGLMLATLARLDRGDRELSLPSWAPYAAKTLLRRYPGVSLREDGPPDGALFMAADLLQAMDGHTLKELRRRLPRYAVVECEVPIRYGAAVLRRVRESCRDMESDTENGLSLTGAGGSARMQPLTRAIRISAEAASFEAADELCTRLKELALQSDRL